MTFCELLLSPPRLNFNKNLLNHWVGSLDRPVQACHSQLNRCCQDRVHTGVPDKHSPLLKEADSIHLYRTFRIYDLLSVFLV